MKCPVCPDATLAMMDRQGIEIDYCPQCRGVWLDRGELDKLIGLAQNQSVTPAPAMPPVKQTHSRPDFVDSDSHAPRHAPGNRSTYGYQPERRKSWLNDIFD